MNTKRKSITNLVEDGSVPKCLVLFQQVNERFSEVQVRSESILSALYHVFTSPFLVRSIFVIDFFLYYLTLGKLHQVGESNWFFSFIKTQCKQWRYKPRPSLIHLEFIFVAQDINMYYATCFNVFLVIDTPTSPKLIRQRKKKIR